MSDIKRLVEELATSEGEIMREVGISPAAIVEFAREWNRRCAPILDDVFRAGGAAAADIESRIAEAYREQPIASEYRPGLKLAYHLVRRAGGQI